MRFYIPLIIVITLYSTAYAQQDKSASGQFVGTWTLEKIEKKDQSGQWINAELPYLGSNPKGYIIYDSGGNMSVNIMGPGRPAFAANDRAEGTFDEYQAALAGYIAYFGSYEVNEQEGYVIHHRIGSVYPNDTGVNAKRFYQVSDDELILMIPANEQVRATWKRLN